MAKQDYQELLKELDRNKLPNHIGLIMDGNGRWAQNQGAARVFEA